jgi:hypothetical protein
MCFWGHFVPQKVKMPIKTLIIIKNHPGNNPKSPVLERTSRLIHFLGVFVVHKGRYSEKSDFYMVDV